MEVASVTSGTCACLQKWQEWVFGSLGDLRLHLFAKTLVELHMASLVSLTMCPGDLSLLFHGLLLPKETHSVESLKFAQEFRLKDSDVVVVTYPKSGRCFWRLFFSEFVSFVIFTKSVFFLFLFPWWFYFDWIYSTTTKRLFPKIITLKWCIALVFVSIVSLQWFYFHIHWKHLSMLYETLISGAKTLYLQNISTLCCNSSGLDCWFRSHQSSKLTTSLRGFCFFFLKLY